MVQNESMTHDAAMTIRIPSSLKRRLEARAEEQHRSLSAQVVADPERSLESLSRSAVKGRFLGLYEGTAVPTDDDLRSSASLGQVRMQTNSDFRDLFAALNGVDAEYLVVGALALARAWARSRHQRPRCLGWGVAGEC